LGDLINLRTARKKKAREFSERIADQNRTLFGRSKNQKKAAKLNSQREKAQLDGHKLNQARSVDIDKDEN